MYSPAIDLLLIRLR